MSGLQGKTTLLVAGAFIISILGFTKGVRQTIVNEHPVGVDSKSSAGMTPVVQSRQTYEVLPEEDIVYAQGLSHEAVNSPNAKALPLLLDVYVPDNELENRPVFLFIHGGGFSGGTKQQARIVEWANYYTARGWVFVSADYRLKKHKGTVPQKWIDASAMLPREKSKQFIAMYPAHRDAKAALRWVVANAERYRINTNYITVGGGSAGAVTAITLGVSNPADYRDELSTKQDPTLSSTNLGEEYQIRTIIDLWGSKAGIDVLGKMDRQQRFDRNDPSLFIAHGTEDPTVPYSKAEELKACYEETGVPFVYYPLEGKKHGAWGARVNGKELAELAFDFIVEQQNLIVE
ncbi:carboxylesterase family protein [Carboxylicivirga sp. RSCT41]|uniref:carboxylesterase family protein n=1 Tax=Carboxylicivirga agarovorans TaxID=3417570 RepID=UPI003D346D64